MTGPNLRPDDQSTWPHTGCSRAGLSPSHLPIHIHHRTRYLIPHNCSFTPRSNTFVDDVEDGDNSILKEYFHIMPAALPWSSEERALLFTFIEAHGAGEWNLAALSVHGRTSKQVRVTCPADRASGNRLTRSVSRSVDVRLALSLHYGPLTDIVQ
jgi:hypothetical protein